MTKPNSLLSALLTLLLTPATVSAITNNDVIFITLEEHWLSPALTPSFLANPGTQLLSSGALPPDFFSRLTDLGPLRLSNMTANQIRKQVVSHPSDPAALNQPALVTQANNQLAAGIANNTSRFAGFAYLPMAFPHLAAAELERCVKELGFVGALIESHLPNGTTFDGAAYRPFWAKVAELDVPVYLHPVLPDSNLYLDIGKAPYAPAVPVDFSLTTAVTLATVAWGWHQDAGLQFLRMYVAGVFEEFPTLKIVLGHMGEVVPFMLDRANVFLKSPRGKAGLSLVETYKRNVWITTAGFFSLNPMATVLRATARDRIMYSVDYPFGNSVLGKRFMEELRGSGMVSETEWEGIAYRNAERLLRLKLVGQID
ncbi:hypothetical protein OQA88_1178 [Cercophora sp. LCS_1]